jgi:hypothetical protein
VRGLSSPRAARTSTAQMVGGGQILCACSASQRSRAQPEPRWREMGKYCARAQQSTGGAHTHGPDGGRRANTVHECQNPGPHAQYFPRWREMGKYCARAQQSTGGAHTHGPDGGRRANTVRVLCVSTLPRTTRAQMAGIGQITCAAPGARCASARVEPSHANIRVSLRGAFPALLLLCCNIFFTNVILCKNSACLRCAGQVSYNDSL